MEHEGSHAFSPDGDPHGKNEAPEVTPEEEQNVRILVSELP